MAPPVTRIRPSPNDTAAGAVRSVVSDPVVEKVPVAGSNSSAEPSAVKSAPAPPITRTRPSSSSIIGTDVRSVVIGPTDVNPPVAGSNTSADAVA